MIPSRYELKFLITYADYMDISTRLSLICEPDSFNGESGEYFVRSLYFDDIYSSSYVSKINGDNNRKKYRIRAYNYDDGHIRFECKEKINNKTIKNACPLEKDTYYQLLNGSYNILTTDCPPLLKELGGLYKANGLHPSVVVDYDRTAFVHPLSNTRITFDKHLRTGIDSFDIFNKNLYTLHVFPNDSVIMEVKYDTVIPAHISALLSSIDGLKTSISKYCICKNIQGHINPKETIFF